MVHLFLAPSTRRWMHQNKAKHETNGLWAPRSQVAFSNATSRGPILASVCLGKGSHVEDLIGFCIELALRKGIQSSGSPRENGILEVCASKRVKLVVFCNTINNAHTILILSRHDLEESQNHSRFSLVCDTLARLLSTKHRVTYRFSVVVILYTASLSNHSMRTRRESNFLDVKVQMSILRTLTRL